MFKITEKYAHKYFINRIKSAIFIESNRHTTYHTHTHMKDLTQDQKDDITKQMSEKGYNVFSIEKTDKDVVVLIESNEGSSVSINGGLYLTGQLNGTFKGNVGFEIHPEMTEEESDDSMFDDLENVEYNFSYRSVEQLVQMVVDCESELVQSVDDYRDSH